MRDLMQKVVPNEDGIGYYVIEREAIEPNGDIVTVPAVGISDVEAEIIRLRSEYVSFTDIAKQLGMTKYEVTNRYYACMNRDYEQIVESMNAIRYEELMLLEGQIKHLLDIQKQMPDNLFIVDKLVLVLNRRSKLLGLDAPERIQAQVQVSSFEEQLKVLDASFIEVIEDALTAENSKRTIR